MCVIQYGKMQLFMNIDDNTSTLVF